MTRPLAGRTQYWPLAGRTQYWGLANKRWPLFTQPCRKISIWHVPVAEDRVWTHICLLHLQTTDCFQKGHVRTVLLPTRGVSSHLHAWARRDWVQLNVHAGTPYMGSWLLDSPPVRESDYARLGVITLVVALPSLAGLTTNRSACETSHSHRRWPLLSAKGIYARSQFKPTVHLLDLPLILQWNWL